MAIKTYFQNIADAIRTKGGTSATLTPAEMPQAIADLPSGGGGLTPETPIHENIHNGYISGTSWYGGSQPLVSSDVYVLEKGVFYLLALGIAGNRFRALKMFTDPVNITSGTQNGTQANYYGSSSVYDNPLNYTGFVVMNNDETYRYLTVMKTNTGQDVKSYLYKIADIIGE